MVKRVLNLFDGFANPSVHFPRPAGRRRTWILNQSRVFASLRKPRLTMIRLPFDPAIGAQTDGLSTKALALKFSAVLRDR
jgi:hypothetical protein